MIKEEFENNYAINSGLTLERYRELFVALPCACSYEGCQGWATVSNNEMSIKLHMELYAPKILEN